MEVRLLEQDVYARILVTPSDDNLFSNQFYDVQVTEENKYPSSVVPFYFPFHMQTDAVWVSTQPDLTVPDLADSIESMLARRASGLPEPTSAMMTMRDYPTDPATRVSAVEMLKQIQADGKEELKTLNAEYVTAKAAKAKAAAAAAAEQKAFEEFKAAKQG